MDAPSGGVSKRCESVVDLTFACQVALKNKKELQGMCVARGLTTSARLGKAELITKLLTQASEPRSSPPQSAESLIPQKESHKQLDVGGVVSGENSSGKQIDDVIEIFTMHMASSMGDWMLTTLHLSKACLVCHAWNKTLACSFCHLDSRGLTRQGFMRELKRPAQRLSLCIRRREEWAASGIYVNMLGQAKQQGVANSLQNLVDLTATFNAVQCTLLSLGRDGHLKNLVALDLTGLHFSEEKNSISWRQQIIELSRLCPNVEYLRIPQHENFAFATSPIGQKSTWASEIMLLWSHLRSFSLLARSRTHDQLWTQSLTSEGLVDTFQMSRVKTKNICEGDGPFETLEHLSFRSAKDKENPVDAGIVCARNSASYLDTLAQRFADSAGLDDVIEKNNWGLLELHAPNLELFIFVGGYSVCCQGARSVANKNVRLQRLKAFRWDISKSDSYGNPGWYTHAQLDGMVQCEGSAELALSKLLLDPLRIEAVGIALSPQGFERLKAASHSPFALPLYLQALSLEQHASGASGMHFELPIDTSTAAALRWLKISLKCTFETQLCRNLAISCPMLEHVYIHGPDSSSSPLGTLGRSLTKLQVISVSHASKDEVQALLQGPSNGLRYVEVDSFALTSPCCGMQASGGSAGDGGHAGIRLQRCTCFQPRQLSFDNRQLLGSMCGVDLAAGDHWWTQLCGIEAAPPALMGLALDNGSGYAHTWTSDPAAAAVTVSPAGAHSRRFEKQTDQPSMTGATGATPTGTQLLNVKGQTAQGWQRIRRTCDDQVKLKLDGLQALFYTDLAASIRSSSGPLSAAHAGGTLGRGGQTDDCNITAADLRLVLTGR